MASFSLALGLSEHMEYTGEEMVSLQRMALSSASGQDSHLATEKAQYYAEVTLGARVS